MQMTSDEVLRLCIFFILIRVAFVCKHNHNLKTFIIFHIPNLKPVLFRIKNVTYKMAATLLAVCTN